MSSELDRQMDLAMENDDALNGTLAGWPGDLSRGESAGIPFPRSGVGLAIGSE